MTDQATLVTGWPYWGKWQLTLNVQQQRTSLWETSLHSELCVTTKRVDFFWTDQKWGFNSPGILQDLQGHRSTCVSGDNSFSGFHADYKRDSEWHSCNVLLINSDVVTVSDTCIFLCPDCHCNNLSFSQFWCEHCSRHVYSSLNSAIVTTCAFGLLTSLTTLLCYGPRFVT